jgi:hypothetical protein
LTNAEIIQKVVESPNRLKKNSKSFLYQLRKHNVTLDDNGDPDFTYCEDQNVKKILQKQEGLVRMTLMQSDMEFEYPQKLERMMIKADIMGWLDEEEEKMRQLAQQLQEDKAAMA